VVESPCISKSEDRCKFFTDSLSTAETYGHCLIKRVKDNYNKVRDRFGNKMTVEQIAWYETNCRTYPSPLELIVDPKAVELKLGFKLPEGCGFKVEWVP